MAEQTAKYTLDHIDMEGEQVPVVSRNDDQHLGLEAVELLFALASHKGPTALLLLLNLAANWVDGDEVEDILEAIRQAQQPSIEA